jgi:hypothetical protein
MSQYQPERTIQGQLLSICVFLSSDHIHPSSDGVGVPAFLEGFSPLIACRDTNCCGHVLFKPQGHTFHASRQAAQLSFIRDALCVA